MFIAAREWADGGKPIRRYTVKKNPELREEIAVAKVDLCRMPPITGWSMFVLDKVDVARHQQMKVVPRELRETLFVLPAMEDEERFCLAGGTLPGGR